MFPNPQDALPLPQRPNLERYKKLAKELVKACKSGDAEAIRNWSEKWVTAVAKLSGVKFTRRLPVATQRWIDEVEDFAQRKLLSSVGRKCALTDAQFVIARSHGFPGWPKLAEHIEALRRKDSVVAQFEAAADAIATGDAATLKRLLAANPQLARARSTREHGATLLHYCSANGVEGYRQKTPKKIVKITELLLRAGAEVDAEADVYGGGATALGLAATSVHPETAGVQNELLQLLLDHGASLERSSAAGNRHRVVKGCLANGRGPAAEFLASRGAPLDLEEAAGAGRLDVVKTFFNAEGSLKNATKEQMQAGFGWACEYGHRNVVEFLIEKGVDLRAQSHGETGLHWAAVGGELETVKLLVARGAPLEEKNSYDGTVLSQALWSAFNGPKPGHLAVVEFLIAAGAKVDPEWQPWIDKLRRRDGPSRE